MDAPAAKRLCVAQRRGEPRLEFVLAPREPGRAAITRGEVARRRVEEHHLELEVAQPLADLRRGHVVRERALDAAKPGLRNLGEAVEERDFVEQERYVGGKRSMRSLNWIPARALVFALMCHGARPAEAFLRYNPSMQSAPWARRGQCPLPWCGLARSAGPIPGATLNRSATFDDGDA